MKGIRDKVAVVTGAARGIGRACAERFLAEGAKVALLDIDQDGEKTARSIGSSENAFFVQCDVGYKKAVDEAVATVLRKFGQVDILVNNAGIIRR